MALYMRLRGQEERMDDAWSSIVIERRRYVEGL